MAMVMLIMGDGSSGRRQRNRKMDKVRPEDIERIVRSLDLLLANRFSKNEVNHLHQRYPRLLFKFDVVMGSELELPASTLESSSGTVVTFVPASSFQDASNAKANTRAKFGADFLEGFRAFWDLVCVRTSYSARREMFQTMVVQVSELVGPTQACLTLEWQWT